MIEKLTIENFRAFEKYEIERLARVNLLLGKNNCGKTTVLEAVHLLARRGDWESLISPLYERGELSENPVGDDYLPDVSHLFHGREFGLGSRITLDAGRSDEVLVVKCTDEDDENFRLFSSFEYPNGGSRPHRAEPLMLDVSLGRSRTASYFVSTKGVLLGQKPRVVMHPGLGAEEEEAAVQYVPTTSLTTQALARIWNKVYREKQEPRLIEALRLLDPFITDVGFVATGHASEAVERSGIMIGVEGTRTRVPLGSFGDGMRRILVLAMSMVQAGGGVLLVDEIDTGLHHEKMADMWRMVIETARANDIQVFATTHSLDCERGLASAILQTPGLAEHVAVHGMSRNLDFAVTNDADDFLVAIANSIEMR